MPQLRQVIRSRANNMSTLDPEEVAAWVRHYSSGFFTPQYLRNDLHNLEQRIAWFPVYREWEREYRIAALRQLVDQPGIQRTLFLP